jgi:hypothetical protein
MYERRNVPVHCAESSTPGRFKKLDIDLSYFKTPGRVFYLVFVSAMWLLLDIVNLYIILISIVLALMVVVLFRFPRAQHQEFLDLSDERHYSDPCPPVFVGEH